MKRLIVIAGPTAVGKTAAAISLAKELHTEILSCDSRQFYSELDIGVARPSPAELAAAPHHFIACRSVCNPYNVFNYEHDALALLDRLFNQHDEVIAVGGSGLYIDALCNGINIMPDPAPELRAELSQKIKDGLLDELLEELKLRDPQYYAVVDRNNPIRIQRALEVIRTTGRSYSEIIDNPLPERPFEITKIALHCERDELRRRIGIRVDKMMEQGLMEEAESLLPYRRLNTLNTVGYKELFAHIDGQCTLQQAVSDIKTHTWQYAKKQLTWLRRDPSVKWVGREDAVNQIKKL